MRFKMQAGKEDFFRIVKEKAMEPIEPMELIYPKEQPLFEKYDEYLPMELVRKGFAYGILDIKGMLARILEW